MVRIHLVVGVLLQVLAFRTVGPFGLLDLFGPLGYRLLGRFEPLLRIVGFVATFVGSVALLYKLVADGVARA